MPIERYIFRAIDSNVIKVTTLQDAENTEVDSALSHESLHLSIWFKYLSFLN